LNIVLVQCFYPRLKGNFEFGELFFVEQARDFLAESIHFNINMIPTAIRVQNRNSSFQAYPECNDTERYAVNLRKQKRVEASLLKRIKSSRELTPVNLCLSDLDHFSKVLSSPGSCKSEVLQVLQAIKGFVSRPGIDYSSLILSDVVYKVIILVMDKDYEVIKEASIILCNLTYGNTDITTYMIERGVTEVLVKVIGLDQDITENAIWGIGNLAAESKEICEVIKNSGFLKDLLRYLSEFNEFPFKIVWVALWSCANLVCKLKGIRSLEAKQLTEVLNLMKYCIGEDKLVFEWIRLAYGLLKNCELGADLMVEHNLVSRVLGAVKEGECRVKDYALQAVGVMIYSSNKNAQILISFGVLDLIYETLPMLPSQYLKTVYWVISNIAGGTAAQAHQLIHHVLFSQLALSLDQPDPDLQKELSFVLFNLTIKACLEDLIHIIEQKILVKVSEVLASYANDGKHNLLRFVYHCLLAISQSDRMDLLQEVLSTGVLAEIEECRLSKDEKIQRIAGLIFLKFKSLYGE